MFITTIFYRNSCITANSVDPDQTTRSVASDLGLYCLPCPYYGTLGINGLSRKLRLF